MLLLSPGKKEPIDFELLESQIKLLDGDLRLIIWRCLDDLTFGQAFFESDISTKTDEGKLVVSFVNYIISISKDPFTFKRILKCFEGYSDEDLKFLKYKTALNLERIFKLLEK